MILVVELQFTQLQKLRILKENSYFHGIRTRASLKGASTNWAKRPLVESRGDFGGFFCGGKYDDVFEN